MIVKQRKLNYRIFLKSSKMPRLRKRKRKKKERKIKRKMVMIQTRKKKNINRSLILEMEGKPISMCGIKLWRKSPRGFLCHQEPLLKCWTFKLKHQLLKLQLRAKKMNHSLRENGIRKLILKILYGTLKETVINRRCN